MFSVADVGPDSDDATRLAAAEGIQPELYDFIICTYTFGKGNSVLTLYAGPIIKEYHEPGEPESKPFKFYFAYALVLCGAARGGVPLTLLYA
jgi:hypothetical protein